MPQTFNVLYNEHIEHSKTYQHWFMTLANTNNPFLYTSIHQPPFYTQFENFDLNNTKART